MESSGDIRLDEQVKYVIIDGNHRLRAMSKVREELDNSYFTYVPYRGYSSMYTGQVLGVGFSSKFSNVAGDVFKLSNYEKVDCLLNILFHSIAHLAEV